MGFMWPGVGLLCFFLPICVNKEPKVKKSLEDLGKESDTDLRRGEDDYRQGILDARNKREKAAKGLELTVNEVEGSQVHPEPEQASKTDIL